VLDLVVRGGTIVDGTGSAPVRGDVGIAGGRVVAVGTVDDDAARTVDAGDLLVCPGFVDPHTHYDAQLFWDPSASPSSWHGVTSVIGGNCGFTLAPLDGADADYTRRMMARVEGMPLDALEAGVPWNWHSSDEYLTCLDGHVGVNAGFLVGHCALRRSVLGDEASGRASTAAERHQIKALLHLALEAGALGLSTTRSPTHIDGDDEPVPSRAASVEEVMELCAEVGRHPGTTLEAIIEGCLGRFSDEDMDLLATMSATADRPLNWNVLGVAADDPDRPWHQLEASARARAAGGRVVALTMPVLVPTTMSLGSFCALWLIPGWGEVLKMPVPERIRHLLDPAARAAMLDAARTSKLAFSRLAEFGNYVVGDTFSPANDGLSGRRVDDIARERGTDPFTCVAEIAAADDLRTVLWPKPTSDTAADWDLRRQVWEHPDVLLGGSDAGAHIDRMCGAPYTTRFVADTLRGRRLLPIERAVQLISDTPAQLFGLRGRGRLRPGYAADLALLDPATVDSAAPSFVTDLPGGSGRLLAEAVGVPHVYVNGVAIIADGAPTGATPGVVMRSGRDTDTVTVR
jgi:N-acyl-D-aspartate/D-glutamate deacylase